MTLWSPKQISTISPCKQQVSPHQVKYVHAHGKGREGGQHGRKEAAAKHFRHLLWKLLGPPWDSSQHFYSGEKTRVLKISSRKGEQILQPLV